MNTTTTLNTELVSVLGLVIAMLIIKAIGQRVRPETITAKLEWFKLSGKIWDRIFDALTIAMASAVATACAAVPLIDSIADALHGGLESTGWNITGAIFSILCIGGAGICGWVFARDDESSTAWRWLVGFIVLFMIASKISPTVTGWSDWLAANITTDLGSGIISFINHLATRRFA